MNNCILCGRLVRDPDVRYSQGNNPMAVAKYTLAIDRMGRKSDGNQNADFINCIAFDRNGEFAEKYFRQGLRVLIRGHIQTGNYTNKDGKKVYTTDVIVDTQEFADGKNTTQGGAGNQQNVGGDVFMAIPDAVDDGGLPFN